MSRARSRLFLTAVLTLSLALLDARPGGAGAATLAQTQAQTSAWRARLAIELAAEGDASPISLDSDGSAGHGWAYDAFTRAQLAARAAAIKGTPLDPLKPPANFLSRQLVVLARPVPCGDRVVRPIDVDLVDRGREVPRFLPVSGAAAQALLPGASIPSGAVAVMFTTMALWQDEVVRITYAGPLCDSASRRVLLPVVATGAGATGRLTMPPGTTIRAGTSTVTIHGVVDLRGRLRYASSPDAPAAVVDAASQLTYEPARLNGSPVPWTSGFVLALDPPAAATRERATIRTTDAPGLTTATSRCEVSERATYGTTGSDPIRIGGLVDALLREALYLRALRGPAGEGLEWRQAESTRMAVVTGSEVHVWEAVGSAASPPVRLFFDPGREEPPRAPMGFTCAAPLGNTASSR